MRRVLGFFCIAAMMASMPTAVAVPNGPEEIMIHGEIQVLATFAGIENGSGRTQLNLLQDGGIGLYRGAIGSGFRSCTDSGCHGNACLPYSTTMSSRFEGDDFIIDIVCSFAGHAFYETEWRWSPTSSTSVYDCSAATPRATVEQIWAGSGGFAATFTIDGSVRDTCALLIVDGVGRFSADWH